MELRVWVDGTQRVVCGVKLTTTCQEIVFALAHATGQSGRFTMIERWRNNERLLSPNEQPMVTLQRWGDRMNEVEFILRQQPPAVPAKPRVTSMGPMTNYTLTHQQVQPINNAQLNYYNPNLSPLNMYPNNYRSRQPPGYLDYLLGMANRNPMHSIVPNQPIAQQSRLSQKDVIPRPLDKQPSFSGHQNGSTPVIDPMYSGNRHRYSAHAALNRQNMDPTPDFPDHAQPNISRSINQMHPKLLESGLVVNRGSAVNIKLQPSGQSISQNSSHVDHSDTSLLNNSDASSSVSQMGHDMLKIIEQQKKVLLNQKSELDRLDNDQEYWDARQNSEQAELVSRIENEIRQLEDLWRENQVQIKKLENQNFEREIQDLKAEQVNMEAEIKKQKEKLSCFEHDINACKTKIEELEAELANQADSDTEASLSSDDEEESRENELVNSDVNLNRSNSSETPPDSVTTNGIKSICLNMHPTSVSNEQTNNKDPKSSEEDDSQEDSGGDASDDLNTRINDSKLRSAKDVAYVDKRGLISGIRSLKLDKSRVLNRQSESLRSAEGANGISSTGSPNPFRHT